MCVCVCVCACACVLESQTLVPLCWCNTVCDSVCVCVCLVVLGGWYDNFLFLIATVVVVLCPGDSGEADTDSL